MFSVQLQSVHSGTMHVLDSTKTSTSSCWILQRVSVLVYDIAQKCIKKGTLFASKMGEGPPFPKSKETLLWVHELPSRCSWMQDSGMDASAKWEERWSCAGTWWLTLLPKLWEKGKRKCRWNCIFSHNFRAVMMCGGFIPVLMGYWWVQYQMKASPSQAKIRNLCWALTAAQMKKALSFVLWAAFQSEFLTQAVTKSAASQLQDLKRTDPEGWRDRKAKEPTASEILRDMQWEMRHARTYRSLQEMQQLKKKKEENPEEEFKPSSSPLHSKLLKITSGKKKKSTLADVHF